MSYRDANTALRARHEAHRARLQELAEESPASARRLPPRLRRRLASLRARSEPSDDSVAALCEAEQAAELYEQTLDEGLGLSAEVGKWVMSPWPEGQTLKRWGLFVGLSVLIMSTTVHNLGMTDFFLRALGAEVAVAHHDMTAGPIFLELQERARQPASPWVESEDQVLDRIVAGQKK